jgi:retinol dehydrogenase-12
MTGERTPDQKPDQSGRTILVTGANTGIGRTTALALGRMGAELVLAGRSEERTRPVVDEVRAAGGKAEYLELDLANLASVQRAAKAFLDGGKPLHVLVNNAGLAGARGLTKDGFEITFGTNHIGPFLFTQLLLPRLREAASSGGARIVNVASAGHYRAENGIDYGAVRRETATTTGFPEYCVSKLANVLHAKALAKEEATHGIRAYSLHPGAVASDVWREVPWPFRSIMKLFMLSNEDGAKTSLYCATSAACAGENGLYYDKCREKTPSRIARDDAARDELQKRSLEYVEKFL